jgi:protein translocase SecG subunit
MKITLIVIQILLCLLVSTLIFLQSKGDNENNNILSETNSERRGWEKILFRLTIFTIFLFLLSSIIQTMI